MTPTMVAGSPLMEIARPRTSAAPPYRRCHRPWPIRMTRVSEPSVAVKSRPWTGCTPSVARKFWLTRTAPTRSGSPPPVRLTRSARSDASCSNVELRLMKSVTSAGEAGRRSKPARRCTSALNSHGITRRSGSANGSGRTSTASTTLNIAALAPMPSASVVSAMRVNPGRSARARKAVQMSCICAERASAARRRAEAVSVSPAPGLACDRRV